MDMVVAEIKPDEEKVAKAVHCQLYQGRKITKHDIAAEEKFIKDVAAITVIKKW